MLDTDAMKRAISEAIDGSGLSHAYIADQLGVSPQAVTGWRRTGRIDKRRLPALARVTKVSLSTFMPDVAESRARHVRSEDPPPYGDIPYRSSRDDAAALWAAYQAAPVARQRAIDLLLMDEPRLSEALEGHPALVAGIELLDTNATEALAAQKKRVKPLDCD